MPLLLQEVTDERDFDEILPMLFAAFGEPYNSLRRWFFPIHTTTEAAVEASKQRHIQAWREHPDLHWVKVTDTDSGKIIGAAEWEIRPEVDPDGRPQVPINAYWHTEGSVEKEFAEKLLTSLKSFMKERMTRPHLELEQLIVHPEHRRRGAGRMLNGWGIRKADELGLESCVESVPFAVPIYERLGYGKIDSLDPQPRTTNPDAKWNEYASDDLRVFLMWRPAGRDYQDGNHLP